MRRSWTAGAAGWIANDATFDELFAPVTASILVAVDLRPGDRVLDVGCGSGTLLAAAVAAGAEAVGVDVAEDMVQAARQRVPKARVLLGDAQTMALGGPYDRMLSRFGVMFFADPAAAFANVRRAAVPGARLVFACWRSRDENPMFTLGTDVLTSRIDPPPAPPPPGAPGPTSFADRDRLAAVLADSGWPEVQIDPVDFVCDHGRHDGDGVEERLSVILGTTTGRLARERLVPVLTAQEWEALLDDVRAELRAHLVDGAVRYPAATWLVRATA